MVHVPQDLPAEEESNDKAHAITLCPAVKENNAREIITNLVSNKEVDTTPERPGGRGGEYKGTET